MSVKSHVSYQWGVTSAVGHESPHLWVTSWQGRGITRQWRFDEQLQRKITFKRLVNWCFLKNKSLSKISQYFRRGSIGMYDQWNGIGVKLFWFFNSPINLGKNWNGQNTDCNYLSRGHLYNTSVENLPSRQSTPIPSWSQCENYRTDFSSDKRRQ